MFFYTMEWNIWFKIYFPEQLFKEFLKWCTHSIM